LGSTTFDIIGTGGNGVGTTQQADLTIGGVSVSVQNHDSTTLTIGDKIITVSLDWTNSADSVNGTGSDIVAVCGVYSDGYDDSYGTITVTVQPNVKLTNLRVWASDGGEWDTYSLASSCGFFHLFVGSSYRETVNDVIVDGFQQWDLIGTDGNGAGTTQQLQLTINDVVFNVANNGCSVSKLFGDRIVTASFVWFNRVDPNVPQVDFVATCSVGADGYPDSFGTLTIFQAAL